MNVNWQKWWMEKLNLENEWKNEKTWQKNWKKKWKIWLWSMKKMMGKIRDMLNENVMKKWSNEMSNEGEMIINEELGVMKDENADKFKTKFSKKGNAKWK